MEVYSLFPDYVHWKKLVVHFKFTNFRASITVSSYSWVYSEYQNLIPAHAFSWLWLWQEFSWLVWSEHNRQKTWQITFQVFFNVPRTFFWALYQMDIWDNSDRLRKTRGVPGLSCSPLVFLFSRSPVDFVCCQPRWCRDRTPSTVRAVALRHIGPFQEKLSLTSSWQELRSLCVCLASPPLAASSLLATNETEKLQNPSISEA